MGIVYDVSEHDLIILDGFEDGYRREKTFRARQREWPKLGGSFGLHRRERRHRPLPKPGYKRLIIDGASIGTS